MKIQLAQQVGRIVSLVLVTVFAIAVMAVSSGHLPWWNGEEVRPPSEVADDSQTVMPVQARRVSKETVEIIDSYVGMIEPWERFNLSFPIAGQIELLGPEGSDRVWEVGDEVSQGQILARLDQRILMARRNEAAANLENAEVEYQRLASLRQRSPGSVSETNFQQANTQQIVAKAMLEVAEKNLEDSTLRAPVDGVISARKVNRGEAVNMHQAVFEVVQVERVLLSLGVPESRIVPIQRRFNAMKQAGISPAEAVEDLSGSDQRLFKVHVKRYGHGPSMQDATREPLTGIVYRIAETASDRSGLFRVEVALDNPERLLKPGLVAKADLIIDQWEAYRLPVESAIFRDDGTFIFLADRDEPQVDRQVELVGITISDPQNYVAREQKLEHFLEQGRELLVRQLPRDPELLVVRGQHRLSEGRKIQIMAIAEGDAEGTVPGASGRDSIGRAR